ITDLAVKTGQSEPDPDTGNDSAAAAINAGPTADLGLTKSVDRSSPVVGDSVTFTVTATNHGPDGASGVVVDDLLPAGLTFVSATPSTGGYDSTSGAWTLGALAAAQTATLTVAATVNQTGAVVNQASVAAQDQVDPNPLNNTAAVSLN